MLSAVRGRLRLRDLVRPLPVEPPEELPGDHRLDERQSRRLGVADSNEPLDAGVTEGFRVPGSPDGVCVVNVLTEPFPRATLGPYSVIPFGGKPPPGDPPGPFPCPGALAIAPEPQATAAPVAAAPRRTARRFASRGRVVLRARFDSPPLASSSVTFVLAPTRLTVSDTSP